MTYSSSVASAIQDYLSCPSLYDNPQNNLAALAVMLHPKRDVWELESEICEHYVYVMLDPRKPGAYSYALPSGKTIRFKHRPYYVGKGKDRRLDAHFKPHALLKKHHKNHTILAIQGAGFDPRDYVQITKTRRTDCMAQALEIDMIAGIGRADLKRGPLTNLTHGGDGASGNRGGVGKVLSAETRAKIGAAHKGRKLSEAHKAKMRANYRLSDEGRRKLAEASSNRDWTPEMRERIRVAIKGRKATPETRAKLSAQRKGRKLSEAHREKLRTCVRVISDEARARMSAVSSRPKSEETKAKIRAAALAREAAKREARSSGN